MSTEHEPERSVFSNDDLDREIAVLDDVAAPDPREPQGYPKEITITDSVRSRTVEDANAEVGLPLAMRLAYEDVPRRLQTLAPYGIAVDVATLFLDSLFDLICPPGSEDREEFIRFYNRQIETVLASAESNLDRMRLMQGVPGVGR